MTTLEIVALALAALFGVALVVHGVGYVLDVRRDRRVEELEVVMRVHEIARNIAADPTYNVTEEEAIAKLLEGLRAADVPPLRVTSQGPLPPINDDEGGRRGD